MVSNDLLILRGMIVSAPEADQKAIKECADKIKLAIADYGDNGLVALALVGLENQDG